jgi:hypothetical protein
MSRTAFVAFGMVVALSLGFQSEAGTPECSLFPTGQKTGTSCSIEAASSPDFSIKGWEIYSWKSGKTWRFALVRGANRLLDLRDVEGAVVGGVDALKTRLTLLSSGSEVYWNTRPVPGLELRLPPRRILADIERSSKMVGLMLKK